MWERIPGRSAAERSTCAKREVGGPVPVSDFDDIVLNAARYLRGPAHIRHGGSAVGSHLEIIQHLDSWVRRYVRRICHIGYADDLADDALQYLLIVLAENHHSAAVNGNYLTPWCKRVVRNFIISEVRSSERWREVPVIQVREQQDPEVATEAKQSVSGLIRMLRNEIAHSGPSRGRLERLTALDRWISSCLTAHSPANGSGKQQRHRLEQQHWRDRCVARRAYEELVTRGQVPHDYFDVAEALGLAASRISVELKSGNS